MRKFALASACGIWLALSACGGGIDAAGDADRDGISNADEGFEDQNTDGDDYPDYLDLDMTSGRIAPTPIIARSI